MTKIVGVPVGLITRLDPSQFEVLIASEQQDNPYEVGARYKLDTGRFCGTVISQQLPLMVANAKQDSAWDNNPDVALGMVSYLGLPLLWPDGQMFGTLCVFDRNEHSYSVEHQDLLAEFKTVIEGDLRTLGRPEHESAILPHKNQEEFRYLYEGSPIPYQSLDSDGRIIEVNQALLDELGYSREELIGRPFRDILPKEDVQLYLQRFAEFKKSGSVSTELQLVRKDQQPVHAQLYGTIAYHPDGSFKQTHCVWLDVTERLQAEHALRESEATARALLNTPSVFTILLDSHGIILDANEPMVHRFHKSRQELIGLCLWDLLAPEVLKVRKEIILSTFNTSKIQRWEDYRAGAWFESCVEPIVDESGTVNKVAIVAYDITEHKRAQEALEKSERKYRELVDEAATIILRWDINGNVTFFNEYAQKFFGFREDEIVGKNVVGTIVPDTEFTGRDLTQLMKEICYDPAKFENNENENIKRNGERVWIAWKNRPIYNQADELIEIHSVGIDISARKRAEDALRESEALWRSLAENSPDRIVTLDENLNIQYANYSIPGISKQDLIGTPLYQYVVNEKQSEKKVILERVLKSGKSCTYETQYSGPDGQTQYYESIAAPRIVSGKVIGLTVNARDITAHKQAQQALRRSQDELESRVQERTAKLEAINLELKSEIDKRQRAQQALEQERRLFVSGPTVVFKWRASEGWPVEYVSPNVLGEFGYAAEDFTSGKVLFADLMHPDDLVRISEEIKVHTQSDTPHFEQEYRLAHRNGEYLWLYDFTVVVRNDAGEITHFHGYVIDITERKQAEQKILATESELRGIFNSLQDVYYRADAQGCIVRVSPSADQVFGYHPDEIIGQPTTIVWRYPEKRQEMLAAMQANGGTVQNYEAQAVRKDGVDFWASVNAHFLYDAEGNIAGVEGTIRDINQRKQAEQELKRQTALFEAVFRDVPDGMVIANVNREVLMCNPALTRIFGYQQQDIVGKQTKVLYDRQEEFERQGRERFNLAAEEQLLPYVTNYRRKDGTVFPGETVGTAIRDDAGYIIGFIGVIRDITERKRVEEEVQRSRQHFQHLDRISRVLTAAEDLNAMLWNILKEMLDIFEVDRTWLLYPCDPQAPTWRVPVEVTRTGYEGAFALGTDIPNKPEAAAVFEQALKAPGVVTFDLYRMDTAPDLARDYGVRTQMVIALNPKMDKPWLLGMHQCSYNREWSEDDKRLFRDIAERVTGALTNRLLQDQLEQDIDKRKRIEAVEKGRSEVLELLAMGAPIEAVLHKLVINAEENNPRMLCSVLLLDVNGRHLRHGAAPSLPAFYNEAIDGMEIGPEAGSCGAAAYTGESVIVEDVMTHAYWIPFRELAARVGIRACWSEPIVASNGRVMGTFAIYYREPRIPTSDDLRFIRNSARLAGIAIERRHSEEQAVLHQAELAHMSRLNVMGEMATGIAHELNQPLTAIANYASAASKLIDSETQRPDKVMSVLDSVQVQAKRASEIIHRLRKFVKKQTLQQSSVDLNHLVADVMGFMEIETKNYNVQVQLQLQDGLPIVYVDAIHIEQVLMNLIRNSLEAMMLVNENARLLTVRTQLNHEGVPLVEIADTGPGIDRDTLKQIFEPFVTTKGTKGMGMGLSISRSIVEAHGGRLWAESEPGKGARFFLTVPVRAD